MSEENSFPPFDTKYPIRDLGNQPQTSDPFDEIRPMDGGGGGGGMGGNSDFTLPLFQPQRGEGFEEVQLKGNIRYALDNETEFVEERTGWILWRRLIEPSTSQSSSSSQFESSSSPSSDSVSSGSAKDSCIVPVSWGTGWTALYCVESKDVIFIERQSVELTGRKTKVTIDPKFLEVCKVGSVEVYGCSGQDGLAWSRVEKNYIVITRPYLFNRATAVNILMIGIRSDVENKPWPEMTKEQFDHNEERIKSFYPKD